MLESETSQGALTSLGRLSDTCPRGPEVPERTCSIPGCQHPPRARGWCATHHQRWRITGTTDDPKRSPRTCTFLGCQNPHNAKGLCYGHRGQQRRGEALRPLVKRVKRLCEINGCDRWARTRGHCGKHQYRVERHGDPYWEPVAPPSLFWKRVRKTDTCWLWIGPLDAAGYGSVSFADTSSAHRMAWVLSRGKIPDGLELDHLCRVRRCVNPEHLEPVTHAENMRRAAPFRLPPPRQLVCVRGHLLAEGNLLRRKARAGHRECLTCIRDRARVRSCADCLALPGESPSVCVHTDKPSRPRPTDTCGKGHPFDAENTAHKRGGRRRCRRCHREGEAARKRRLRSLAG